MNEIACAGSSQRRTKWQGQLRSAPFSRRTSDYRSIKTAVTTTEAGVLPRALDCPNLAPEMGLSVENSGWGCGPCRGKHGLADACP